jgi:transcriptional regulator with XRE-family HTH domain
VADAVGVSHVTLGEIERGDRPALRRDRWQKLEEALPGFSVVEVEGLMAEERPVQLDLSAASPQYRRLGLELARRIEKKDLSNDEIDKLTRILRGKSDDE